MQTIKNHVTLIGNMGQYPQIKETKGGKKIARFSVATNDYSKDKTPQWHRIVAWGTMAQYIEDFGEKGKKLAIHGKLVKRTYLESSGKEKTVTEIEVKQILGI